jgi:hypothetical protein
MPDAEVGHAGWHSNRYRFVMPAFELAVGGLVAGCIVVTNMHARQTVAEYPPHTADCKTCRTLPIAPHKCTSQQQTLCLWCWC